MRRVAELGSLGVSRSLTQAKTKAMTQISITTALVTVIALIMPACDQASTSSQPVDRVKALEAEIERLKAAKPAAPKPIGELNREFAAALLNKHLATPHVSELAFNKGGLDKAKRDGIVTEAGGFPPGFRFTEKGIAMAHGLVNAQTRVKLAPFGMEDPKFPLSSQVAEHVAEVTGIALAPVPNICEAEYVTQYLLPAGAAPLTQYIYSGQRTKSTFQKYDDGWRVAR